MLLPKHSNCSLNSTVKSLIKECYPYLEPYEFFLLFYILSYKYFKQYPFILIFTGMGFELYNTFGYFHHNRLILLSLYNKNLVHNVIISSLLSVVIFPFFFHSKLFLLCAILVFTKVFHTVFLFFAVFIVIFMFVFIAIKGTIYK